MFSIKNTIGHHRVFTCDADQYKLRDMLETLYDTRDLYSLQDTSHDYVRYRNGELSSLNDIETDLHKRFYNFIKTEDTFKTTYIRLINDILEYFFPDEDGLVFQTFPSIRIQFTGSKAVPPHCDSDELGRHPVGEINFLIPITKMEKSNRLFIESEPNKKDFEGIDLEYGELLNFNGSKCVHYNQTNAEPYARISFDFRVIKFRDYVNYIKSSDIAYTNPRDPGKSRPPVKMTVGGYYQCIFKSQNVTYRQQVEKILQTRPSFDDSEADACYRYFKDGDPFLTEYKKTEELENMLKRRIGAKYCFMVPSGTSAIITALVALDIKPGDTVIVPNYTMVATMNAVRLIGATPHLIDVSNDTFTIEASSLESHIQATNAKVVIHVSLNNRSKNINDIVDICKRHSVPLIEDAAQSLGCTIHDQHYGTFGAIGCFSLSTPKIITTGQGGFLVTNDDDTASRILRIKNFGRRSGGVEEYDTFGVNFKLEWFPWFVDILVKNRDLVARFLDIHGIQTRITYPTLNSVLKHVGQTPNSDEISNNGLFLPTHMLLTDEDILFICNMLKIIDSQLDQV